jgi:hypothetical protein
MKNAYLNSVFISRLYLRTIQKNKKKTKQKYIVNKTNKDEKKKIIKYIESQYIPFNLLKMNIKLDYKKRKKEFEMNERKKMDEMKRRREKNELKGLSMGVILLFFSDDHTDKLLNNIIFNYSIGEFSLKF